jgi:hypothetical protein
MIEDSTPLVFRVRLVVITDRFTARILGAVVLLMTFTIDVGSFMFTKPELRSRATFPLLVLIPSLPLALAGVWLLRKSSRLPDEED